MKWGGIACGLAVGAVWILTLRFDVFWVVPGRRFALDAGAGMLQLFWFHHSRASEEWTVTPISGSPRWTFRMISRPGGSITCVPLLLLAVPPLLASGASWRLDVLARRRSRVGLCKCGYDLSGLAPDVVCPECGKVIGPVS
jgi:hypothetical protein